MYIYLVLKVVICHALRKHEQAPVDLNSSQLRSKVRCHFAKSLSEAAAELLCIYVALFQATLP